VGRRDDTVFDPGASLNQIRRCLVLYPWSLEDRTGAHAVLLAYCRALREVGYVLDVVAPGRISAFPLDDDRYFGVFDRVFGPPRGAEATMRMLESAGLALADPHLPAQEGRDETGMAAAAVLASVGDYDLIAVHYTRCHSLRRLLPPHIRTVLFTYDLDAIVAEQERLVHGIAPEYSVEDEVRRMRPFDLVTVVGPDDLERVRGIAPDLNVIEAPFSVPATRLSPVHVSSPGRMLWLSAAAPFHIVSFQWFWQHAWPRILRDRPHARLVVAGRIAEVARSLGADRDPAIELRGVVRDTRAVIADADVMLAPYYYGDGTKIKVLEALAHGLPVVTTTRGLSNTRLVPGEHLLVGDDGDTFARHVIDLLGSAARRESLASAGLDYIARHHDPEIAHAPLRAALRSLGAAGPLRGSRAPALRQGAVLNGLKQLVPWAIDRTISLGATTVAMYGAGSHTRALLPIWDAAGGPVVSQIIVSAPTGDEECGGVSIVSADEFDPSTAEAIVLSSQAYEHEMASTCASRWPHIPVVPIWRPLIVPRSRAEQPDGEPPSRSRGDVLYGSRIPGELCVR
jgi:hypothetical protein